ncbi:hypothetical protein D3C84_88610 [compost metagenome]
MGYQSAQGFRLPFPHVHHQPQWLATQLTGEQGLIVPHLATGGIDEELPLWPCRYLALPQQVEGGIDAFAGEGHVEADDIGRERRLVIDEARGPLGTLACSRDGIRLAAGPRRIAAQHPHAERLGLARHAFAGVAGADDGEAHLAQVELVALRQHQQGGEHIVPHRIFVTTGGAEEGDAPLGQERLVDVIRAYGGGAHEGQPRTAGEQPGIDPGHRAHQQHLGILQIRRRYLPPRQGYHLAKLGKQLAGVGHVFINDDLHRALFLVTECAQPATGAPF